MAKNIEIAVLEAEDLLKFNGLFYYELLLELPEDALILGAINTEGEVPQAAGLLIFHVREASVFVDWLYVDENCRRRGVGTALMDFLKNTIMTFEESAIDGICLNFTEIAAGMGEFLRSNGFAVAFGEGHYNTCTRLENIRLMRNRKASDRLVAVPLNEVSEESFKLFKDYIDMSEDIADGVVGPIKPENYRKESRAIMNGDRIVGIMLISDTIYSNNVMIDWVYAMRKYVIEAVPLAFDTVISELKNNLPGKTLLSMTTLSKKASSIVRKTMPDAVSLETYSAFWTRKN